MIITEEIFKDLDAFGGRPYSARGLFGRKCLGFVGLSDLLRAIRSCEILPTDGWCATHGRETVYYHPAIWIAASVVDNYYLREG